MRRVPTSSADGARASSENRRSEVRVATPCHSDGVGELSLFEQLESVVGVLAELSGEFDARLLSGQQAGRVVCAAEEIERYSLVLKTLAVRRVDESGVWRVDGSRSPQKWLANKTGTSLGEAYRTVELAEQLEELPEVSAAARQGVLSPVQTRMIASAAVKDPASEGLLVGVARQGTMTALQSECVAAAQRGAGPGAMAKIHARRSHRDWIDAEGAFRYKGTLTPDKGARFKKTLAGFTDQVFHDARRAGVRDSLEAYAADALVRMADAALLKTGIATETSTDSRHRAGRGGGAERVGAPKYTESLVQLVLLVDGAAWERGYTLAGETCEIAGIGPVDVATAKRMCGHAIVDIVVTRGVDVRTLAHAGHTVTRAQYAALLAEGYECNVEGCGNSRFLEIDHLGDGWAVDHVTCNGQLAWKCPHCHDLKSHKGWKDGPRLPNGKRTLIPPANPPPDTG